MDWKKYIVNGWNCAADEVCGTVIALSEDGTKQVECNAFDDNWMGMSDVLDDIIKGARLGIGCVV